MLKTIKTITFVITFSFLFITLSCLTKEEKIVRTPALELSELTAALDKLTADGYDIDTTALGIYFIVRTEGTGPLPQAGDTCYLEYAGRLLDGTLFDASLNYAEDAIWKFVYKDINLIPGFDDGIALMNKGSEIDMIIPSPLAYGAGGYGMIAPFSSLIFSAKMHDLKPRSD